MTNAEEGGSETKKAEAKPEAAIYPRKSLLLYIEKGDSERQIMQKLAVLATSPELAAYRVISGVEAKSGLGDQLDVPALMKELRDQASAVNSGDLKQAEAMLMNQATALQSLFSRLAERGMGCADALPFEANMRMALRAQNQCRATLETLATIKNPPVLFAKQANVTTGPQQINNGIASSRARENQNLQNELSGAGHELLPDAKAPSLASATNRSLETLGAIDRAEVRKR